MILSRQSAEQQALQTNACSWKIMGISVGGLQVLCIKVTFFKKSNI
jgi:hypothetical protein